METHDICGVELRFGGEGEGGADGVLTAKLPSRLQGNQLAANLAIPKPHCSPTALDNSSALTNYLCTRSSMLSASTARFHEFHACTARCDLLLLYQAPEGLLFFWVEQPKISPSVGRRHPALTTLHSSPPVGLRGLDLGCCFGVLLPLCSRRS